MVRFVSEWQAISVEIFGDFYILYEGAAQDCDWIYSRQKIYAHINRWMVHPRLGYWIYRDRLTGIIIMIMVSYAQKGSPMPNSSFDLSKLTKKETSVFSSVATARLVWLRQRNRMDEKGQELYRRMQAQGVALTIVDAFDVTEDELLKADLVLLDAFDSLDGSIETVVARIRFASRVPLIMLTNGYSSEQLVTALTAGVDAIWSLNTPVELLLARCNALLRRWLPPHR